MQAELSSFPTVRLGASRDIISAKIHKATPTSVTVAHTHPPLQSLGRVGQYIIPLPLTGRPDRMCCTGNDERLSSSSVSGHNISCCLVSLPFLWAILSGRPCTSSPPVASTYSNVFLVLAPSGTPDSSVKIACLARLLPSFTSALCPGPGTVVFWGKFPYSKIVRPEKKCQFNSFF